MVINEKSLHARASENECIRKWSDYWYRSKVHGSGLDTVDIAQPETNNGSAAI